MKTDSTSNGFITIDDGTGDNRWYIDDNNGGADFRVWRIAGGAGGEALRVDDVFTYDSDEWQHVLVADDGTGINGVRVYVDGRQVGTRNSFDYSGLTPASILRLGAARHADVYRYLKGDLDDFGVWRIALTDAQAKALYSVAQHEQLGYDLGQVQQLFNAQDERRGVRVDGRYWTYAQGLSADTAAMGQVIQDGHRFTVSLTEDGTGVIAPGRLVAHWTFDDGAGTTVVDSKGFVHGTLTGSAGSTGTWIADGRVGGALQLDSSRNQYVLAGSDNLVTNLPGEKTIAFWARVEQGSTSSNGFISIDNGTSANRWYIDTGGAATADVRMYKAQGDTAGDVLRVNNLLEFGVWRHIAFTDDGTGTGGLKLYVDGQLKGTRNSFEFADLLPGSLLRLGAARHASTLQFLEGALDDFGIWSVALTSPQVLGLFEFATEPGLGYDLGQVQQLFELHEAGPGGGTVTLDGVWRWQYAEGLTFDPGVLNMAGGNYFIQLDAAGTGLMAVPEPGALVMLACILGLAVLGRPKRRRSTDLS